ncbi:MAG: protein translocase subunit SecD [Planctomycetota bacterium]
MEKGFINRYVTLGVFLFVAGILTSYALGKNAFPLGNDLAGGADLIYRLDPTELKHQMTKTRELIALEEAKGAKASDERLERLNSELDTLRQTSERGADMARDVIQKRVDPSGTTGVQVRTLGGKGSNQRIEVSMPKATSSELDRIRERVEKTGNLRFHRVLFQNENSQIYEELNKIVDDVVTKDTNYDISQKNDDERMNAKNRLFKEQRNIERIITEALRKSASDISAETAAKLQEFEVKLIITPPTRQESGDINPIIIETRPAMDGSSISSARSNTSEDGFSAEVNIIFKTRGAIEFGELTKELSIGTDDEQKKLLAIVLDGRCYSAPRIIEPILQGHCRITGRFDPQEAEDLAQVLQTGSLPMTPELISKTLTGPTLGRDAIRSGMTAIVLGGIAVLLFMGLYYRRAGVVANLALFFNLILLLGMMCFLNAHMTLPGIAGILLTVGMSVDANVLIFERIREEASRGRSLKMSIQHGFDRALVAILDSNITTFLTGLILYYFGVGPIKGFATTLMLGIITSLFSALFISRTILEWASAPSVSDNSKGSIVFASALFIIVGLINAFGSGPIDPKMIFGLKDHIAWGIVEIVAGILVLGLLKLSPDARGRWLPVLMALLGGVLFSSAMLIYSGAGSPLIQIVAGGVFVVMLFVALAFYLFRRQGMDAINMSTLFVFKNNIDFMGKAKGWMTLSAVAVVALLAVFFSLYSSMKGIQFTGGTKLTFSLKKDSVRDIGEIRKLFNDGDGSIRLRSSALGEKAYADLNRLLTDLTKDAAVAAVPSLSETADVGNRDVYLLADIEQRFNLSETGLEILRNVFPKGEVEVARLTERVNDLKTEIDARLKQETFTVISVGAEDAKTYRVTNRIQNPILSGIFQSEVERTFASELIDKPIQFDPSTSVCDIRLDAGTDQGFSDSMAIALIDRAIRDQASIMPDKTWRTMLINAAKTVQVLPGNPAMNAGRVIRFGPIPAPVGEPNAVINAIISALENIDDDRDRAADSIVEVKTAASGDETEKRSIAELKSAFLIALSPEPIPNAESISDDISGQLQASALEAIIVSLIVIFLYIFMRFDFAWSYGAGAVIALFHDVTITLGLLAIAHAVFGGMHLSLDTVAAVLTIIGYSLNDTIVVFDRIRETRQAHRTKPISEVVNESINQCLSRTLLTSITTLVAVICLLVFGGEGLRPLSLALFIGVIVGTYSSIFIASPIVVMFMKKAKTVEDTHRDEKLAKMLSAQ